MKLIRQIFNNPFEFFLYSFFLSLLFTIVIVFLTVSISIPYKFREMINVETRIFISGSYDSFTNRKFDYELYTSSTINENVDFKVKIDEIELDVDFIFYKDCSRNFTYVNQAYADEIGIENNDEVILKFGSNIYSMSVVIADVTYFGFYLNDSYCDPRLNYLAGISINEYDDIKNILDYCRVYNIDTEECMDYGLFDLFRNIQALEYLFLIISFIALFYGFYSMMNVVNNKLESSKKKIAIMKLLGLSNKIVSRLVFIYFIVMAILSIIIACGLSQIILLVFTNESSLVFDKKIIFNLIWYAPLIAFIAFVIIFYFFGTKRIKSIISKTEIVDFAKEAEL